MLTLGRLLSCRTCTSTLSYLSNRMGPDLTELRGFLPFVGWSQFQIASHQQGLAPVVLPRDISTSPTIFSSFYSHLFILHSFSLPLILLKFPTGFFHFFPSLFLFLPSDGCCFK